MSDSTHLISSSGTGAVDAPPCHPPVEIIERDGQWLLREYRLKPRDATVFETVDGRIDAMRAADDKLAADRHPCLLRWDAEDVVGDLYWNELFERLRVKHSRLLDAWVVVPDCGHYVFHAGDSLDSVCGLARAVQRQYDFRELVVSDEHGQERGTYDHRFIRHDIASSGVRFERGRPLEHGDRSDEAGDEDDPTEQEAVGGTATGNALTAAVPDVTELEELDTTGLVFGYRATWDGGDPARIALLNPDYVSDRDVVKRFTGVLDDWEAIADAERVTTVFEIGPSPAPWVAYDTAEGTLAERLSDLSLESRVRALADVGAAVDTARDNGVERTAISPRTVRVTDGDEEVRASLAGWGLAQAARSATDETAVTPYTAPEQLTGEIGPTTPVYQLGALAYRLVCRTAPFADAADLRAAVRTGQLTDPSEVASVPSAVDSVFRQAMAPTPDRRYARATAFVERLDAAL